MNVEQTEHLTENAVLSRYQVDLGKEEAAISALKSKWSSISYLRGGSFLLSIVFLICGFATVAGAQWPWFVLAGVVFLAFLVIAFFHVGIENELFKLRIERQFTLQSIKRLKREWTGLPEPKLSVNTDTAVANDLDLFGEASLMGLISTAETPMGQDQLAEWILEPADVDEVSKRQSAVKEMSDHPEHTRRLRLLGKLVTTQQSDPAKLLNWASQPVEPGKRNALFWYARVIAIFNLIAIVLCFSGMVPLSISILFLFFGLAVTFITTVFLSGSIYSVFNEVAARQQDAEHYLELIQLIGTAGFDSPYLQDQQSILSDGKVDALAAFSDLARRTWLANLRRNGILYFLYLLLQYLFLWDVHILQYLNGWRARYGKCVEPWFKSVGRWESIASLSKVARDHPHWTFPEVTNQVKKQAKFVGESIGHPLLTQDQAITNSVQVGPVGSILLVTGSNMSGKSTLLRSIGLNIVLAQMGSVTFARKISMPRIRLETSIRIRDSLADGVSFYFAELERLKEVVSVAESLADTKDFVLLYLLDEILQGTNSGERQIAVRHVLKHLYDSNAIGAISTHDLELVDAEGLTTAFQPVHFRETITNSNGKRGMTFDYRLREGIATTTNALELLRLVGLGKKEGE